MKARIDSRPMTFQYEVWFYDNGPEGTVIFDADGSVQERLAPGDGAGEPSLVISQDALEALIAAGSDHLPPSSAMERHLADATGVRDRLLTLVERQAGEPK